MRNTNNMLGKIIQMQRVLNCQKGLKQTEAGFLILKDNFWSISEIDSEIHLFMKSRKVRKNRYGYFQRR